MIAAERARFDALLEEVIEALPDHLRAKLEEVPLIVDDRPSAAVLRDMGLPPDEMLCGLHSGVPLTERSVEHSGLMPEEIRIYREGIVDLAGGWDQEEADDIVFDEIWVTVLHEMGHHFGLDEKDLEELGYE